MPMVCTKTVSAIVTQPTAITTSLTKTNVSCFGGNNGSITVAANGAYELRLIL